MTEHLLCIAVPVPGECGAAIDRARAALQPTRRHMPAHVTLIPPVRVDDVAPIVTQVHDAVSGLSAFPVELRGVGSFRPESRVVFVRLASGAPALAALRDAIATGPLASPRPFTPHVTIANRCADGVLDEAERQFADFGCTFTADRVVVYEHGPEGWWELSETRMRSA